MRSFAEFAEATAAEDAFGPSGVLSFMHHLPQFAASLADPAVPPDISDFIAAREKYLEIFDAVFTQARLDAVVFPQMRDALEGLNSGKPIHETVVSEINIAGLPAVMLPAGYYASGAPFGLVFVGRRWSEAALLAMAFDYESATHHRRAPELYKG